MKGIRYYLKYLKCTLAQKANAYKLSYHTEPVYPFPIHHQAYMKNLSIRIGRCNARKYMSQLLPVVLEGRLPATRIMSHVLPLHDGVWGYEIFDQRIDSALKVLLKPAL